MQVFSSISKYAGGFNKEQQKVLNLVTEVLNRQFGAGIKTEEVKKSVEGTSVALKFKKDGVAVILDGGTVVAIEPRGTKYEKAIKRALEDQSEIAYNLI